MSKQEKTSASGGTLEVLDLEPPSLYKVCLLNDDYTTMEFVVNVLETVFHKSNAQAVEIMKKVHKSGCGVAGVYPYDIAVTKAQVSMNMARRQGFPFRCEVEEM